MTAENAIQFVQKWNYPYWKLYKNKVRVSECGPDENSDASPEIAVKKFVEEVQFRGPGTYEVNVFARHNGDKSGQRLEFTMPGNTNMISGNNISLEALREQVRNELEIKAALARLEDKLNAIGEFLYSRYNEDSEDDFSGLKKLAEVFQTFRGMRKDTPSLLSTEPTKGISKGFFS